MSMSAFQNTAPFLPQTGMVAEVSSSVRYLPLEIWEQDVTLASRSAALTEPSLTDAVLDVPEAYEGSVAEASRAAPATAPRASVRERTVGGPSVRKVSLPGAIKGGPSGMAASTLSTGLRGAPVAQAKRPGTATVAGADRGVVVSAGALS